MASDLYVFSVLCVIAAVTIALRATPFVAMARLSSSRYLRYLSDRMPVGVMILLVAYTFKDVSMTTWPYGLPLIVSMIVAIVIHWLTSNPLLAIGSGLACHLVIVNTNCCWI